LKADELLTEIRIPKSAFAKRQGFAKLRTRAAIDFPSLNMAVALEIEKNAVKSVALAVGALAARPAMIKGLDDLKGSAPDARFAEELARRAHKQCKPLTNIGVDPEWRHDVLPVLVRRMVLRAAATSAAGS
jgi:CO/xanthine dehydrogenase FAD-binding subunit